MALDTGKGLYSAADTASDMGGAYRAAGLVDDVHDGKKVLDGADAGDITRYVYKGDEVSPDLKVGARILDEDGKLVEEISRDASGAESGKKRVKPEAAVTGSKKHGVKWKEGQARAKTTGNPQGQWAQSDLEYATEIANTLKPGESGYFDLPKNAQSIVHLPDGTILPATRMWIRNNGTGTWHGYPMQ